MKIDRLLGITIYLLNHRKVNAKLLASKFEVSIRTIQRDIETLCKAGIPIVSYLGVDGGYEILESFNIERQIAEDKDYFYIIAALKGLLSAYENPKAELTLEKIKSIATNNLNSDIVLDFSVLREDRDINEKLKILEEAIAKKYVVSFIYTNADNITTIKKVEPVAVVYKWYSWYLLAYSAEKEDYRLYKLIRMKEVMLTNENITKIHESADVLLKKNNEKDKRKYIDIKLFCKSEIRTEANEYLKGTIEFEYENGDFIMGLHLPEKEKLWFGILLSFGNLVKVLEPEALKNKISNKCSEILDLYI